MESEKCKHDYTIRVMTSADTPGALRVFASHGLFEANHSLDTYRLMDCNAFYVAIDDTNGAVIGVCGGPFLRPDMAFIGLYGVDERYAGRGIGQKLFAEVMTHIGDRNVCLWSVADKLPLYRDRLGFGLVSEHRMVIYFGKDIKSLPLNTDNNNNIKLLPIGVGDQELIDRVIDYDQQIQGYRRQELLGLSLREPGCVALVAIHTVTDQVVGYGCVREHSSGATTLSPVYGNGMLIARQLMEGLVRDSEWCQRNGFYYYTVDTNRSAIELAGLLALERHEDCRLLFRKAVVGVDYHRIYSILSPNFSL
ncbi:unnamed protein product [Oppiella nova]|uniref:N-acetyltransferase domain-containing protein n=1 Tax=Oppiella nova TaxID=334625 RepID=A0A7R9QUG9_9ACAR|nr:unnamed protein product [Oppiella nova]CAG2176052.1 unnamed protein product [Oppiella nova]